MPPVRRRRLIISAAGLTMAAVSVLGACQRPAAPAAPAPSAIGGPFRLETQDGVAVNQSLLAGKWSAVYFGYTFCPDVCPTTLAALAQAQAALGPRAARFQVIFITVDPARDTPAQLKRYLASPSFPKGVVGLTGTAAQVKAAAAAYHVYYARHGSGVDYSVDHTSIVYLMDPKGRFVAPIAATAPAAMADQIRQAMAGA